MMLHSFFKKTHFLILDRSPAQILKKRRARAPLNSLDTCRCDNYTSECFQTKTQTVKKPISPTTMSENSDSDSLLENLLSLLEAEKKQSGGLSRKRPISAVNGYVGGQRMSIVRESVCIGKQAVLVIGVR